MKTDANTQYTLREIIKHLGLPVFIRKENWSNGFTFRAERIANEVIYGTAFKDGVEHRRKYGEYTYRLDDMFYVLRTQGEKESDEATAETQRILENESEMAADKEESDLELARLKITDIVRYRDQAIVDRTFPSSNPTNLKAEETLHINRIIGVIKKLIHQLRAHITSPEPPFMETETAGRGIQVNPGIPSYITELERNAAHNMSIAAFEQSEESPYFCHMNLKFEDRDESENVFVGERVIYAGGEPTVISWQSPVGGLAYDHERTSICVNGKYRAYLQYKRDVVISDGMLSTVVETYNRDKRLSENEEAIVFDSFLLKVLEEKRQHKELTNIIPSIQRNQNTIIRAPQRENFVVQGCAGCGKTMILLHRISYLLYNYTSIGQNGYLVLSPSRQFNRYIQPLLQNLRLEHITVNSISEYYIDILRAYNSAWKDLSADERLYNDNSIDSKSAAYFYSLEYEKRLHSLVPRRVQALKSNEQRIGELLTLRKQEKDFGRDCSTIESEIEKLKRKRRITIFDDEFSGILPSGTRPGNRKTPVCKAELYATVLLNYFCYGAKKSYPYIFIDEGQDLSAAEYILIRSLNQNAVFNIYGDMDQKIFDHSIQSWDDLSEIGTFSKYSLNENYRNTMQITDFVNDELVMNMVGLGLNGEAVDIRPTSQINAERRLASTHDRKAIIYKDAAVLNAVKENTGGYALYSIREVKGMEFETVLVIPNGMTDNELYIAYTRALNRLFLLDV